jgi:hypothetical protein
MQGFPQTHEGLADGYEAHGGAAQSAATAAGAGDNTYVNGPVIDRMAQGKGGFMHCAQVVQAKGALSGGFGMNIYSKIQHGALANGSDMADYLPPPLDGVPTPAIEKTKLIADASTEDGVTEGGVLMHVVDLGSAKQYIRGVAKVDLLNSGTDTAVFHSVVLLGGNRATA